MSQDTDTRRLARAVAFAAVAHQDQVYTREGDIPNEPYILHCIRVAQRVPPRSRVVAVLHDCLEDTGTLPNWLTYSEKLAIDLVSRRDGETYSGYINRLIAASNMNLSTRIAKEVKIADLRENLSCDPSSSLADRYIRALKRLGATING